MNPIVGIFPSIFLLWGYTPNYLQVHVTTYMCLAREDDVTSICIAQGLAICIPHPTPAKNQLHKHIESLKASLQLDNTPKSVNTMQEKIQS